MFVASDRQAETVAATQDLSAAPAGVPLAGWPGARARADRAADGLLRARPDMSAGAPVPRWQGVAIAILAGLLVVGLMPSQGAVSVLLAFLMALIFSCVVAVRLAALGLQATSVRRTRDQGCILAASRSPDAAALPTYSVLVPLYREADIVPQVVASMARLDYPPNLLDIQFILECDDAATHAAFDAVRLPGHMRLVVVPEGSPRTKPRALNYALQEARGDVVVVYDAEDQPEPDQLRRAVAAFRAGPCRLGCLQAHLNIYNADANWLTRQFTIEYSVLFDAILPALERLGLPVLLGGTSNHFPRAALLSVGGWDAYNVTEDADLGIRLARAGWHVGVLASTTWEEAPPGPRVWLGQRTRWLKGWMQTYLVHMRDPARLWRELGPWRCCGLHVTFGAVLLSSLVHPWFYVLCLPEILSGRFMASTAGPWPSILFGIVVFNLIAGYAIAIALGLRASRARGHAGVAPASWTMPIYWLAISFAAYRALVQLVRAPHFWEKTAHQGIVGVSKAD